jgi:tetratricopeptide (TPR) repeat protein
MANSKDIIPPERPITYFVGRLTELEKIEALLTYGKTTSIVAIQGMGGIGKTALALQFANKLQRHYVGGLLWTRLGQHPDIQSILNRWGEAVGRSMADFKGLSICLETMRKILVQRGNILVVLDDVWDYESAALLIQQALPVNAAILLTTRDAHLVKRLGCQLLQIDVLTENDSLMLFSELLGPLGRHETAARQVARLVGYLPLALRILAGVADQPGDLADIALKLENRSILDVLALEPGELRDENVEASLKLSYDGLDLHMQQRFRALGIFAPAPFSSGAVAEVWGNIETAAIEQVPDILQYLARKGLLTRGERNMWSQHGLLRAYAKALLERAGEADAVRSRHAMHYGLLAKSCDWQATEAEFEQVRWGWEYIKQRGSAVYDYFDAVKPFLERRQWNEYLNWALDGLNWARQVKDYKAEGDLLNSLGLTFWKEARYADGMAVLQECLSLLREHEDQRAEAHCLNRIGLIHREQGQWDDALNCFERSLALQQYIKNKLGEGYVLNNIGLTLFHQFHLDKAEEYLNHAQQIFNEFLRHPVEHTTEEDKTQAREGQAIVLNTMGRVCYARQHYDKALNSWNSSLEISKEIGDLAGETRTMCNLGYFYLKQGELEHAKMFFQDSLTICKENGHRRAEGRTLNGIGEVYTLSGQYPEAVASFEKALNIHQQIGDRKEEAITLNSIGRVYFSQDLWEDAMDFFRRSSVIAHEIGDMYGEGIALGNIDYTLVKLERPADAKSARKQAAFIFHQLGITDQYNIQYRADEISDRGETFEYY